LLTSPPNPCTLVTAKDTASLVTGAQGRWITKDVRPEGRHCLWEAWKVPARLQVYMPRVYGSVAEANRYVTDELAEQARMQPTPVTQDWDFPFPGLPQRKARAALTPPRVLTGVGDRAYYYTMGGIDTAFDLATLVVRKGNVVVYIDYQAGRGAAVNGARRAGTFVAGALAGLQGGR
ncbi:hypothetical protein, partial [Actinomadura darangshiensis]|uniref:hypothetical protein n=1 Tax=Actinomadura darangshiensis TaxID=705336 RepID=UPI00140E5990